MIFAIGFVSALTGFILATILERTSRYSVAIAIFTLFFGGLAGMLYSVLVFLTDYLP